jgi:hypothetical protein
VPPLPLKRLDLVFVYAEAVPAACEALTASQEATRQSDNGMRFRMSGWPTAVRPAWAQTDAALRDVLSHYGWTSLRGAQLCVMYSEGVTGWGGALVESALAPGVGAVALNKSGPPPIPAVFLDRLTHYAEVLLREAGVAVQAAAAAERGECHPLDQRAGTMPDVPPDHPLTDAPLTACDGTAAGDPRRADWLPDGWWMRYFPRSLALADVDDWLGLAQHWADPARWRPPFTMPPAERPEGEAPRPDVPCAREWVAHAHLLLGALPEPLPGVPPEPTGPMSAQGCLAHLRRPQDVVRAAMPTKTGSEGGQAAAGRTPDTCIVSLGSLAYRIGDHPPVTVSDREDTLLQAFLDSPTMNKPQLAERTGLGAEVAVGLLRGLRGTGKRKAKYEGIFAPAIRMPGGKGQGGYHVNIRHA